MEAASNVPAVEELEERIYYLTRLVDASNDGFWDWHVPSGKVQFGGRWGAMLGYDLGELEPSLQTWKNLVHPDDMARVQVSLQRHLDGLTDHYQTEHRLRMRTGEWRWILDRGRVVERGPNGEAIRACGAHIDITEQKMLELEKERIANEREQLLGMASHELKNPMQAIMIGVETIENTFRTPVSNQLIPRALVGIRTAMRRMQRLVNDLLDTTLIEGKRVLLMRENVTWAELIQQALQGMMGFVEEKSPRFVYRGELDTVVDVDIGRMVQVLTNLLHNAIKFNAPAGQIVIEAANSAEGHFLRIRDHGKGVAKADYEHVFQRFWQGQETAWQGTGLGLYIARGLVEAHGGSLHLVDTDGPGSTFELSIP